LHDVIENGVRFVVRCKDFTMALRIPLFGLRLFGTYHNDEVCPQFEHRCGFSAEQIIPSSAEPLRLWVLPDMWTGAGLAELFELGPTDLHNPPVWNVIATSCGAFPTLSPCFRICAARWARLDSAVEFRVQAGTITFVCSGYARCSQSLRTHPIWTAWIPCSYYFCHRNVLSC
jgi:hypothetical protein